MAHFLFIIIKLIWVFDVINLPQFEFLDTTVPINFVGWSLIYLMLYADECFVRYSILKNRM